ncbi:MAG TPA: DUF72 domain-containing protein [Ardenticatenaceae bacterium]|jgi:uncharacterized protein YecE (DUF72 family)
MTIRNYYLGCPIWGQKNWVGELFTREARPGDFLQQYASVFNTVEGNTTFYGMPTETTVARWREETPPSFRFCFKFPRVVSHNKRLVRAEAETEQFLEIMAPLGERLGPFFLQLPPSFGVEELPTLERFLARLPIEFQYAVEVRHASFFNEGPTEAALDGLLADLGVDRVCFDVRGLRAAPPDDPMTREAQEKKPDVPARFVATASRPFVRFVAHSEVEANLPLLEEWAEVVAGWIGEGRTPFVFMHAPDDFYAPRLARHFHRLLSEQVEVGTLPRWPAEEEPPPTEQLALF